MINTKILFFGATAQETGAREIEFAFEENSKASDALRRIVAEYPQLEKHSLLFAVNQEYVGGDEIIKDGDELAVFTAVSGG